MILVDVYIPSIDMTYNFSLNEEIQVKDIIDEITEMVERKEGLKLQGDSSDLVLCSRSENDFLPKDDTLIQCGIETGDSLILV
ncbi:MAG: glutamyl-tRNA amidotransferase [Lachnospiraceae bacterium]|nr:glutamyl-tRNA amidotransferase [Lachnospiraceae bacterium]